VSKKRTTKRDKEAGAAKHVGKITHPLKFPAIPVTQTKHTLYLFTAKASTLFASLSINRRIEDKDEGYQRVLAPSRVNAIARYVAQKRPKVRTTVERRFRERESKLLERVPDEKRMIAQACLLAAMEQKSKASEGIRDDVPV
jgi:hypothetical protein